MLRLARTLLKVARRRRQADGFLLKADRFELAATAERMRVDRNGSVVSLLVVEPSATRNSPADIQDFERRMAARLRLTDTAGWLRDGRIAMLLPDTPESGAWKVAADLCEAYSVGADRPACEVIVYPEGGSKKPAASDSSDDSGIDVLVTNGSGPSPHATAHPTTPASVNAATNYDKLLVRPLPLWKRGLDIFGASVGLTMAGPLIAAGALAVRLTSSGPAFFVQEREGLGGHRFRMYKLRTMRCDAEQQKSGLRDSSEQDGPAFKMANDPRVTTIGRLLRKTSLDELPQLWNVLKGDMSLVGPRPLPVDESMACQPWQRRRLSVTPGLTCTWQIHGRNVVPFDEWIRMDLDYAERRSPWLDLKLVAQTGPSVILQKGR